MEAREWNSALGLLRPMGLEYVLGFNYFPCIDLALPEA